MKTLCTLNTTLTTKRKDNDEMMMEIWAENNQKVVNYAANYRILFLKKYEPM